MHRVNSVGDCMGLNKEKSPYNHISGNASFT